MMGNTKAKVVIIGTVVVLGMHRSPSVISGHKRTSWRWRQGYTGLSFDIRFDPLPHPAEALAL